MMNISFRDAMVSDAQTIMELVQQLAIHEKNRLILLASQLKEYKNIVLVSINALSVVLFL
jgi:hypothetical protein